MKRLLTCVLIGAALAAAIPASAHHAVQTVFDLNRPVTVTGSVTAVEWVNPHSYISIDVKGDKDVVQHWVFELPGSGGVRQLRAGLADRGGLKTWRHRHHRGNRGKGRNDQRVCLQAARSRRFQVRSLEQAIARKVTESEYGGDPTPISPSDA
jgi:hypothetical protein